MWWKAEGTLADAVNDVEWNLLDLLTVKHDEVILADEKVVLCNEHQTLFLIVPMIDPTQDKKESIKNMVLLVKMHNIKILANVRAKALRTVL